MTSVSRILGISVAAIATLVVGGCASTGNTPTSTAQPGYICEIGDPQTFRGFYARVRLKLDGEKYDSEWRWQSPRSPTGIQFTASGGGWRGDDPKDGGFYLTWPKVNERSRASSRNVRLELSTVARSQAWFNPPFASEFEKKSTPTIWGNWEDLLSFARGADSLTLSLTNNRMERLEEVKVDPSRFLRAQTRIVSGLATMKAMVADYENACMYWDDIDPQVIII